MAESFPQEGESRKHKKHRSINHIKMIVIEDLLVDTITPIVEQNVCPSFTVDSDASTSYVELKNIVKEHRPKVIPKKRSVENITLGSYSHQ